MNSTLSIKRAIIENIDSIMDIVSKCTEHMISNGIFQWNDAYPSRETFLKDIEDENLYVLLKKDKIIDCNRFIINFLPTRCIIHLETFYMVLLTQQNH